jgi:hypothetical protein
MRSYQTIKNIFYLVLFFNVSGCAVIDAASPSRADVAPEITGADPESLKNYTAFYVPPIRVYEIKGDILKRVDDRATVDLAEHFRAKIIRALDSKHTSFSQPASGVAMLKVAISDISTNYATLQLRPGILVPNSMRGGASIEATFVDSVSGKEILTFRDSEKGERVGFLSGLGKWDGAKRAFDSWARQLGETVN